MSDDAVTPSLNRRQAMLAGGAAAGAMLLPQSRPAQAAIPMQGEFRQSVYRFKLGSFEITALLDGAVEGDGPYPTFGEDQPEQKVQDYAAERFLPTKRMENTFTPIVVNTGKEVLLFDAGNGMGRRAGAGLLYNRLVRTGLVPSQVDAVLLTHFHPDHIGGLMQDGQPVFTKARYYAGEAEYAAWTAPEMMSGPRAGNAKLVQENVVPLKEKMTFLKPGQDAITGVTAVDVSGHTPGMLAYRIESGGKALLIWGDVTNHAIMSLEQPDWHVRFDMDKEKAVATRKRIFDMVSAEKLPVTGYHMPFPSFGFVEKTKDGRYRWNPVIYQFRV